MNKSRIQQNPGNRRPQLAKKMTTILAKKQDKLNDKNIAEANEINEMDDEYMNDSNGFKKGDKIELTEKELDTEMPSRQLQAKDPQTSSNIAYYAFKDRNYKRDDLLEQLTIHFSMEGEIIHKEGPENKIQEEIVEIRTTAIKEARRTQEQEYPGAKAEDIESIKRQLRNKFNYSERQTQTLNHPIRERGVSTEPPPSQSYSIEITQWEIYDTYAAEFAKEDKQNQRHEKQESSLYSTSFKKCLKIMERMTVQNEQQQMYHDYRYLWGPGEAEEYEKKKDGAIYPLWRFCNEIQRKRHVTCLAWNPRYADLFAVGHGSYDFSRRKSGLICLYSLKNTKHPEYSFTTEQGVMCLDFHPKSPALISVGLYDGTVMVFDIRSKFKKPIYQSTVRTNKHTDPVWQIVWNPDNTKSYNFYSVSSDGRVTNWTLMKNKLEAEEVIKLKLVGKNNEEEVSLIGFAGGLCFDFNKFEPHVFLVGTEEGKIHKCSRAYSGHYQETYEGHLLAIYKVRWNNFHDRTFISVSADWTTKIWDSKYKYPIMSFDLGTQGVDVMWAPYSSTVFAVATLDKVAVYDLSIEKYNNLAEQKYWKPAKLTNICFNCRDPILLVGDTHGGVILVKLSPNLTKGGKIPESEKEATTVEKYEYLKIDRIISDVGKFDKEDV